MPAWRKAHTVSPEQSKADGPLPPDAYGAPTLASAAETAAPAPAEAAGAAAAGALVADRGGADPADPPSAPSVCGPTTPSTVSPCAAWNARTAARVCGP